MVSANSAPPSSFTIWAPAAMSSAALRDACCGHSPLLPKGISATRTRRAREEPVGGAVPRAAPELPHPGARRHELGPAAERLLRGFLVAAERHVGDEEAALAPARDISFGRYQ